MAATFPGAGRWPRRRLMQELDSTGAVGMLCPFHFTNMGQQLNKYIKRKRRAAYLKRKKERTKVAAKKK